MLTPVLHIKRPFFFFALGIILSHLMCPQGHDNMPNSRLFPVVHEPIKATIFRGTPTQNCRSRPILKSQIKHSRQCQNGLPVYCRRGHCHSHFFSWICSAAAFEKRQERERSSGVSETQVCHRGWRRWECRCYNCWSWSCWIFSSLCSCKGNPSFILLIPLELLESTVIISVIC